MRTLADRDSRICVACSGLIRRYLAQLEVAVHCVIYKPLNCSIQKHRQNFHLETTPDAKKLNVCVVHSTVANVCFRPDQLDYSLEYLQGISGNIPTLGTRQSRNEICLHDHPVKKFDRVRPSTISFKTNMAETRRRMQTWKDDKFMLGFTFSRVETSRKGLKEHF